MKFLRKALRYFCTTFPVRGRYRLADKLGKVIAPSEVEYIDVSGTSMPIDHSVAMYRYIYYGLYEEHFVNFLKREIRKGDIVIEPGVNVGFITAVLSGLVGNNGRIIALEPSKICYNKIKNYLVKPNITLLNKALAEKDGQANFTDKDIVISHGYSTLSEFTEKEDNDNEYAIDTTSIDSLFASYSLATIRLVKLDIEGAELKALQGASNALSKRAIDFILVETTFDEKYDSVNREIGELLKGYGYSPFLMESNSLVKVDYFSLKNTRHDIIWTYLK